MNEYISPQRAAELINIKQNRVKKTKPTSKLPVRFRNDLVVRYNSDLDEWEVREGEEILYIGATELEARQERERLEDERA